jgi:hypothetical protein
MCSCFIAIFIVCFSVIPLPQSLISGIYITVVIRYGDFYKRFKLGGGQAYDRSSD